VDDDEGQAFSIARGVDRNRGSLLIRALDREVAADPHSRALRTLDRHTFDRIQDAGKFVSLRVAHLRGTALAFEFSFVE
jgi:hypothetical protein